MERLRHGDLRALLSWTRGLHEIENLDVFPLFVLKSIREVLGVDNSVYGEFSSRWRPLSMTSDCSEYAALRDTYHPALEEHVSEHPLILMYTKAIRHGVAKISDFATPSQFRRLGIYNEYYRPLGVNYQIAFELPVRKKKHCAYILGRARRDFSERDRTLLHLMQPYLLHTYRILKERARLRHFYSFFNITASDYHIDRFDLTPREREVIEWVARGKTNLEVGIILGLSSRTVQKHLERLFVKLGVENRTAAAIAFAMFRIDHIRGVSSDFEPQPGAPSSADPAV